MGKKRKTKKKKTRKKTGGARFPGLGKKIKEILDKQKELNGRLHDIEHFLFARDCKQSNKD